MKVPLSILILTMDEEKNIERCLKNIASWATRVLIVDSGSSDRTCEIARSYGAEIKFRTFDDFATQFNWGLDHFDIRTPWVMKLDADEYLTEELKDEIAMRLAKVSGEVSGFLMKRRVYFMGKWIRWGGYYPTWFLRLWRRGRGRLEARAMDEHTVITGGRIEKFVHDFVDDNRKSLRWWMEKHRRYAVREARAVLEGARTSYRELGGEQVSRKRWLKENVYYRLPLFIRPLLYFFYRYFLLLGFLDGIVGLKFHFLQGLWYRWLVDVNILKMKRAHT